MIIGYARVSTQDQNLERQLDELKAHGCEKIFMEKISGTKKNRPEFVRMFEQLREGDVIIVSELSRISRSTKDLIEIVERCKNLKINIKSLKEGLDLTDDTATGKLIFGVFSIIAQFERDLTAERVKSSLTSARARGRVGGRPKVDRKVLEKAFKMYDSKIYSISEIQKIAGIGRATLYKYLEERKNNQKTITN